MRSELHKLGAGGHKRASNGPRLRGCRTWRPATPPNGGAGGAGGRGRAGSSGRQRSGIRRRCASRPATAGVPYRAGRDPPWLGGTPGRPGHRRPAAVPAPTPHPHPHPRAFARPRPCNEQCRRYLAPQMAGGSPGGLQSNEMTQPRARRNNPRRRRRARRRRRRRGTQQTCRAGRRRPSLGRCRLGGRGAVVLLPRVPAARGDGGGGLLRAAAPREGSHELGSTVGWPAAARRRHRMHLTHCMRWDAAAPPRCSAFGSTAKISPRPHPSTPPQPQPPTPQRPPPSMPPHTGSLPTRAHTTPLPLSPNTSVSSGPAAPAYCSTQRPAVQENPARYLLYPSPPQPHQRYIWVSCTVSLLAWHASSR
jgi:hypothetical protein